MLAKILGLTIQDQEDLKPGTLVVYWDSLGVIFDYPAKHKQSSRFRIAVRLSESSYGYPEFFLIGNQINWHGYPLRFPNPFERLVHWWKQKFPSS